MPFFAPIFTHVPPVPSDLSLNPFTDAPVAAWIWTQECRCRATAFYLWEPIGPRRELLGNLCWIAEMK